MISGDAQTNRREKRKAILGPASRALRMWPAGKKLLSSVFPHTNYCDYSYIRISNDFSEHLLHDNMSIDGTLDS